MRPIQPIVLGAFATSPWIPLDIYTNTGQLKLDMGISGTATAQVDYTDDDPFNPAITPAVAGQIVASGSASSVTNFVGPVPRAIRLNVTAWTSGTVTLKVIQQGIGGV